jgi:predicted TPR repeat methyltransferase
MIMIFKEYAEYYDLLNENKDYIQECDYIVKILSKFSNTTQTTIYDFGTGTGLHAAELALRGFQVHGIDLSREMISVANQRKQSLTEKEQKRLKFSVGDLRNYKSENPRSVILSLFHVVSYQVDDLDIVNFFTTAAENLNLGGLFIFDYWFLPAVINLQPENRIRYAESDSYLISRVSNSKWISEEVVSVTFDIKIKSKISSDELNLKEVHNMRGLDIATITRLMPKQFTHLGTFKWLTLNNPTNKDWTAISVFKKIS